MVQLGFLLTGKVAVMAAISPLFGISRLTALRSGLMLAPGGEFTFVAFGEAAAQGILPVDMVTQLYQLYRYLWLSCHIWLLEELSWERFSSREI